MMGRILSDKFADHVKDSLTWLLAGLGVTFAAQAWVGGMLLALAGATFAIRFQPERDKVELWSVVGGAFLVAHVAGTLAVRWSPEAPVQIVMAGAGFFSRYIIRLALRIAGRVESRADRIADRAIDKVLPGNDRKDR